MIICMENLEEYTKKQTNKQTPLLELIIWIQQGHKIEESILNLTAILCSRNTQLEKQHHYFPQSLKRNEILRCKASTMLRIVC